MHIAEVVTIAKSLPLLRLNTYKSLILSYSADYRRIFQEKSVSLSRPFRRTDIYLLEHEKCLSLFSLMNLVNFSSREQAEALALCIRVQCGIVACFYAHGLPEPIN